jgi:hypothetical protein
MSRMDFGEKFIFTQLFKFSVFFQCGILGKIFFAGLGYNGRDLPLL